MRTANLVAESRRLPWCWRSGASCPKAKACEGLVVDARPCPRRPDGDTGCSKRHGRQPDRLRLRSGRSAGRLRGMALAGRRTQRCGAECSTTGDRAYGGERTPRHGRTLVTCRRAGPNSGAAGVVSDGSRGCYAFRQPRLCPIADGGSRARREAWHLEPSLLQRAPSRHERALADHGGRLRK